MPAVAAGSRLLAPTGGTASSVEAVELRGWVRRSKRSIRVQLVGVLTGCSRRRRRRRRAGRTMRGGALPADDTQIMGYRHLERLRGC